MKLFHNRATVPIEVQIPDLFDLLHITNVLPIRLSSTMITQQGSQFVHKKGQFTSLTIFQDGF